MTTCIGEPVSWLRLERHALRDLPPPDRAEVDEHLARCAACREAAAHLDSRAIALPAFDPEYRARAVAALARPARRRWPGLVLGLGLAGAAAVVMLSTDHAGERGGVKGGDLGVELVRDQGGVELDAGVFAPGDRFRVRATCPPGRTTHWDVLVVQEGEGFFPLAGGTTDCGNRVSLPGAFTLAGREPALVCLVLAPGPIDRASLMRGRKPQLPGTSSCKVVVPAGT